ncbi:MAG: polyprenyl synthetase family protein [Clostridia bacterium]|nr:polyprenyl synthetase family protein [Clostridia bacterium]
MLDEARLRDRPRALDPSRAWARIADPMAKVERTVDAILDAGDEFLYEASAHLLRSGGKRLRPALHLLSAEACGADPAGEPAVPMAAALECIHMATLVHDDVIDGAEERRGRPTVHRKWGAHTGVIVGDYLFARAFAILADVAGRRVLRLMSAVVFEMAQGEMAEQRSLYDLDQTKEQYFERVRQKTAAFIAECCRLAAVMAGAGRAVEDALWRYGMGVGMGYQIVDDLLDFTADPQALGKPVAKDLRSGVLTLPVLHALSLPELGPRFRRLLEETAWGQAEMESIVECLAEADAIRFSYDLARRYAEEGREGLAALPPGPARDALDALALALVEREF